MRLWPFGDNLQGEGGFSEKGVLGPEIVLLMGIPEIVFVFPQLVTIRSDITFPVACPPPPKLWIVGFPWISFQDLFSFLFSIFQFWCDDTRIYTIYE